MISKVRLIELLELMPDKIDIDDLLDKVLLLQKIEHGLLQSENGQITTHEVLKAEMTQFFKSIERK